MTSKLTPTTSVPKKKDEAIRFLPDPPAGVRGTPVEDLFNEMKMREKFRDCTDSKLRPTLGASVPAERRLEQSPCEVDANRIGGLSEVVYTQTRKLITLSEKYVTASTSSQKDEKKEEIRRRSEGRFCEALKDTVLSLGKARYQLGYYELNKCVRKRKGEIADADGMSPSPSLRTGRPEKDVTAHCKQLKRIGMEVTSENVERKRVKTARERALKEKDSKAVKKYEQMLKGIPIKKEEVWCDPRQRFSYPLHDFGRGTKYRLGGITLCDEDQSIQLPQSYWENTDLWGYLQRLGDVKDVVTYRETAKALVHFLLWLDFYVSLYVYLEEQAGQPDSVPYCRFSDDIVEHKKRVKESDPARYDNNAESGRNVKSFQREDVVGTRRKVF